MIGAERRAREREMDDSVNQLLNGVADLQKRMARIETILAWLVEGLNSGANPSRAGRPEAHAAGGDQAAAVTR